MEIKTGSWYKLRNGYKAYVGFILPKTETHYPFIGYYLRADDKDTAVISWTETGRIGRFLSDSDFDIIEEWVEPRTGVGYVNVYNSEVDQRRYGSVRRTADEAKKAVGDYQVIQPIARAKIEWTEGVFEE